MRRLLVPSLVLALAGGLFWWTAREAPSPRHNLGNDVKRCKDQLRAIYAGLIEYEKRHGHAPPFQGGAFLGALIQSGIWPDEPASHALLQCSDPGARARPMDMQALDASAAAGRAPWSTSYLLSDFEAEPLQAFPAGGAQLRAIVACGSYPAMSHAGALNVLYTDGSVKTLLLSQLIAEGVLPEGCRVIPLGAESPLAELRQLDSP